MYCKVLSLLYIFVVPRCCLGLIILVKTFKQTIEKMNTENAKSQMRKGMLEYCVMLLLHREASYATDIIAQLKEAELIVVEGTLYPLLSRLKKDGLLTYEWRESTQGPPRKYYALTAEGNEALQDMDGAWNELVHTVDLLKQNNSTTNI